MREFNDHLGQGHFCNALWGDSKGLFCSVAAAEGHQGVNCPFSEESCHVVFWKDALSRTHGQIQCGGEKTGSPTLAGVCQDFEPAPWLREKLWHIICNRVLSD
mgnify:CR=1 FL=1